MSVLSQKERRLNFRRQTAFALPICVRLEGTDQECFARLHDVSENGLGMIISQKVVENDVLWVITLRHNLRFRVTWARRHEEESHSYYCGLEPIADLATFRQVFGKFIV